MGAGTAVSSVGVERYREQFQRANGNGARSTPWLTDLKKQAMSRFVQLGFPSTHEEDWRFTSVQSIAESPFESSPSLSGGPSSNDLDRLLGGATEAARLVFVDGRWSAALSRTEGVPSGVRFESLSSSLTRTPEFVQQHLARYARYEESAFVALSTAFLSDGALVHFSPRIELDQPLQIVVVASDTDHLVNYPRSLVIVERGARAIVQELYVSGTDAKSFTNAVTELVTGEGARLDHCRVQMEGESSYHVATTQSHQARDSVLESC